MNADTILKALDSAANMSIFYNSIVHLLILATMIVVFLSADLKLKRYFFDVLILLLMISVAVLSIISGNPFHLVTFGILAIISFVELIKGNNQIVRPKLNINTVIALIFIFAGFWYPEFVKADALSQLIMSPVGTIPCPTLLVSLGMLNLAVPQVNKVQYIATLILGIFYGLVGVFFLKVYLDIALIALVLYSFYNLRLIYKKKKV